MPHKDTAHPDLAASATCRACERLASSSPPPRDRVATTGRWQVAHAFNANLEGWCVALPTRHVESLDELDDQETEELGPLLRGVTAALRATVGCEKTYVLLLAESEGFHHVHFHVVPRGAALAPEFVGPRIFGMLNNPEKDVVATERMDELALGIRANLVAAGVARAG
jgi:diadenosine tetraphosphate (Ap4A) HIT family hydrolase